MLDVTHDGPPSDGSLLRSLAIMDLAYLAAFLLCLVERSLMSYVASVHLKTTFHSESPLLIDPCLTDNLFVVRGSKAHLIRGKLQMNIKAISLNKVMMKFLIDRTKG